MTPAGFYRSFTLRLAALYLLVFSVSIGVIVAAIWLSAVHLPLKAVERHVDQDAAASMHALRSAGLEGLKAYLAGREAETPRIFWSVASSSGKVVAGEAPARLDQAGQTRRAVYRDKDYGPVRDALVRVLPPLEGLTLTIGRDIEEIDDHEFFLVVAAQWFALAIPVLGIPVGLLMSRAVAGRIDAVARAARQVMAGNLSERVEVRGTGDDFDRLAETLNSMLDRIQFLLQSISSLSDHMAHELRTPLAKLRAIHDGMLGPGDFDRSEYIGAMREAQAQADRLQQIFDALSRIGRIEAGGHAASTEAVDVHSLLLDAAELYAPEADENGATIVSTAEPHMFVGDRHLLFQAVCNLLDNAVKYAPPGSVIRLVARDLDDQLVISVEDNGPGVEPEHLPRLAERFFRAPSGLHKSGLGLGLPLVAAVARLHSGTLHFENGAPGLRATLTLPLDRTAVSSRSPEGPRSALAAAS